MSINAASLRGALSARRLIDADVYGANDREIGEVEDLIIPRAELSPCSQWVAS